MKVTLLSQGLEPTSPNSVGNHVIRLIADRKFHSFTCISAFTSQAGINGFSTHIQHARSHLKSITIVTGVDQKGTSKEALEDLLKLKINAFVFYQPSITIFHPKIYLFEGTKQTELIIGSSNLTSQGLFSNIEASLLISIVNSKVEDKNIVDQVKDQFKSIFDLSDPNLKKLDKQLISDLVLAGIIPTEQERKDAQDKTDKSGAKVTKGIITSIFPKRSIAKIPTEFRGIKSSRTKTIQTTTGSATTKSTIPSATSAPASVSSTRKGKLVWTRRKLPSSSVQGGKSGTNPTGGLRLVQDKFQSGGSTIDQTKYFRKLFNKYPWTRVRTVPYVEMAKIPFEIIINGVNYGSFDLEVRHKPSGEAGQHNYTTSISWGPVGNIISKHNLVSSRLDLYAPTSPGTPFIIDIS